MGKRKKDGILKLKKYLKYFPTFLFPAFHCVLKKRKKKKGKKSDPQVFFGESRICLEFPGQKNWAQLTDRHPFGI